MNENGSRKIMDLGNLFELIPDTHDEEHSEVLMLCTDVKIERIVSKGHVSPEFGWYDQDLNEWVTLLKGAAVIDFDDGERANLKAGDYLNIPAHKRHRVIWTDPGTETIWLAVHYL